MVFKWSFILKIDSWSIRSALYCSLHSAFVKSCFCLWVRLQQNLWDWELWFLWLLIMSDCHLPPWKVTELYAVNSLGLSLTCVLIDIVFWNCPVCPELLPLILAKQETYFQPPVVLMDWSSCCENILVICSSAMVLKLAFYTF